MKNKKLEFLLEKNINIFSDKELKILLDFLESWDLKHIYDFLDEKYKEYLGVIEEIKQIKIKSNTNNELKKEQLEKQKEEIELQELLNF